MSTTPEQPPGSASSLPADTCRQGMSTPETSATCNPTTCGDTGSAIGLQESAVGRSPCSSPDGRQADLFGQGARPANLSAAPHTGGIPHQTNGSRSRISSRNAFLALCLESRLLTEHGSRVRLATWKAWDIDSMRSCCRLSLPARTIIASGHTLYATPTAKANQSAPSMRKWPGCRGVDTSPAGMLSRMGFPPAWYDAAQATPYTSRSLRRSSKP